MIPTYWLPFRKGKWNVHVPSEAEFHVPVHLLSGGICSVRIFLRRLSFWGVKIAKIQILSTLHPVTIIISKSHLIICLNKYVPDFKNQGSGYNRCWVRDARLNTPRIHHQQLPRSSGYCRTETVVTIFSIWNETPHSRWSQFNAITCYLGFFD